MNKQYLEILNLLGSICSITALLIVVFAEKGLIKSLFIFIAVIGALSFTAALGLLIRTVKKKYFPYSNFPLKICCFIIGSIVAIFIIGVVFKILFYILETLQLFLTSLVASI